MLNNAFKLEFMVETMPPPRRRDLERGRGGPNPIELRDFIKGKNHLLKQICPYFGFLHLGFRINS
ncbi:hypothetical protein TWF225_001406 [Orbilia oligospora]|uniref:Uncharacterized protein n=1 Tax=Orbilia oligospora TaxID=2813651 RepID=A0A8H2DWD2_ORBOL|nr:hypothetical protein TWF225_001406 [Orbilia oligospora]KAF3269436.1 hypothetical protein TWF128_005662 [Orbilia oligospora]TGJ66117.1 hypothetical protein EYR41_007770 [Orbilia oligospora]